MNATPEQFAGLVAANRSYRRFDESTDVSIGTLRELVALARITPSGMNRQPLKYVLSSNREMNARIFETLAWAGSLKEWAGPAEGERPAAYIVILLDGSLAKSRPQDVGIAAQTMLLGAVARGLGGCMVGAINKPALRSVLALPEELSIALVIALGEPAEKIVLEDAEIGGDVTYYRDASSTHYVPKRTLEEIIVQSHD
jgi:nitroreductase